MEDLLAKLQSIRLPFAELLGIRFTGATLDRITAEMDVREDLCTRPAILHGGAIMSFADTLGAAATVLNLQPGVGTTTLESKTNFIASAMVGSKILGECTPIHRGRRTQVWQTRITLEDGRLVALVTQTQMALEAKKSAEPTSAP